MIVNPNDCATGTVSVCWTWLKIFNTMPGRLRVSLLNATRKTTLFQTVDHSKNANCVTSFHLWIKKEPTPHLPPSDEGWPTLFGMASPSARVCRTKSDVDSKFKHGHWEILAGLAWCRTHVTCTKMGCPGCRFFLPYLFSF